MAKHIRQNLVLAPKTCDICKQQFYGQRWLSRILTCSPTCHFFSRVVIPKDDPWTSCWGWNGIHNHFGHSMTKSMKPDAPAGRYRCVTGHSVSYQIFIGEVAKGLVVRHQCLTRDCTNPEHIKIGTYKDNSQDMVRAGRCMRGMPKADRMSKEDVLKIFHEPGIHKAIAVKYNVCTASVGAIKRGNTHSQITGMPRRYYGIEKLARPKKAGRTIAALQTRARSVLLTEQDIRDIFTSAGQAADIARRFSITTTRVNAIKRGITFSEITGPMSPRPKGIQANGRHAS